MCLKIYPDQWPVGSGMLSIVKDITVTTSDRFQLHVALQLRFILPPFSTPRIDLSNPSTPVLAAYVMDTLTLLRCLAFMPPYQVTDTVLEVDNVHAVFQISSSLDLDVRVEKQRLAAVLIPKGLVMNNTPTSASTLFLLFEHVVSDALNATPTIPLHRIFDAVVLWLQCHSSLPSAHHPHLVLKTLFRGSVYLTPHIVLHLRFLFHERVAVVSHERYIGFTKLFELLREDLGKQWHGVVLNVATMLLPFDHVEAFFRVLRRHSETTFWLMDTYGYLLTHPPHVSPPTLTSAEDTLVFEWTPLGMTFTCSSTQIVATCVAQPTLSTICSVPVPVPTALKAMVTSMITFLELPDHVRHLILQCQRPPQLHLVWITPAHVPSSFCLPPHLHPCCLVSSEDATVSLVFQFHLPSSTASVAEPASVLIPLQYAWKVNVVSPWESDLPTHMLLNPSMILERLANAPDANRVAMWINSLKSEPYLGENRLEWTLHQVMTKETQGSV